MILAALSLAAWTAGAPPAQFPAVRFDPGACDALRRHVLERAAPRGVGAPRYDGRTPRRLGELPPAAAEYAVQRKVDGCPLPAPVGYRQDYLLPGAADPGVTPSDERSRRR
ncbi:hypothetical protein [Phenylobacterium sp.]|uniref:hypothetical protein n=1 Tax=Phenylobacterium sp. TaxID=1871053 RepID=UPI002FE2685B